MERSLRILIVAVLFSCSTVCLGLKLAPTIRLNSGYEIPVVGLGTYGARGAECEQAVKDAIDIGYRHIDTAFLYGNEVEVGNAVRAKIEEGVIKREDIFVTTKLWNSFHEADQVARAFQKSFDNLNLTYIDLFLMHSPIGYRQVGRDGGVPATIIDVNPFPVENGKTLTTDTDYVDTWKAMEELVKSGRVRSIGVSNFNSEQVERVRELGTIKPVLNQVECHPNLNQRKLIKYLADRNITLTAYSPLGRNSNRLAINDPKVLELAKKYNKTPAQIVLRYTHQNGAIVIPKSTNKGRIEGNIDLFDFSLDEREMQTIHELNTNTRLVGFNEDTTHQYYPFKLEF